MLPDRTGTKNPAVADYQRFRHALKSALRRDSLALRKIADKLVALAVDGVPWAVQEVANRLDGKPAQTVQVDAGKGTYVVMIPVAQESAETWETAQREPVAVVPAQAAVEAQEPPKE